jgi:hypothetical protein
LVVCPNCDGDCDVSAGHPNAPFSACDMCAGEGKVPRDCRGNGWDEPCDEVMDTCGPCLTRFCVACDGGSVCKESDQARCPMCLKIEAKQWDDLPNAVRR